jgi:hypothetical protein
MTTQPLSALTMLLSRHTRRRDFITLLGSAAAAWPIAALGQQTALPVIGFLTGGWRTARASLIPAFRQGLSEGGYVDAESALIEFHWAEGAYDRYWRRNYFIHKSWSSSQVMARRHAQAKRHQDNSNHLYHWHGPDPDWACDQSQPSRGQSYGRKYDCRSAASKTVRPLA